METLKAGIFIDVENLNRCGGWGMKYLILRKLVEAQGTRVIRANAYIGIDKEREQESAEYRRKKEEYRNALRRAGFRLVTKTVKRFTDDLGEIALKANADLDLAVDAILQSNNLDHILICSGDGDFSRLIGALQNRGRQVDVLAFSNCSRDLRECADRYFSGYLVPDLLSANGERGEKKRGILHGVNEEKGFGFITVRTGLAYTDVRDDIFCHISDFTQKGKTIPNSYFSKLKTEETILEFDLVTQDDGRVKAVNITEFTPPLLEQ